MNLLTIAALHGFHFRALAHGFRRLSRE